jgi:hypothetical protein
MNIVQYDINGFTIKLPIGLEQVMDTPVRDSYQDFLKTDTSLVRRHLTALTTLLPKYLEQPSKVLHVFGGVGATAQVIDQCYAGVRHEFWERDPVLVDYLQRTYPNFRVVQVDDSYSTFLSESMEYLSLFDHIMFDPSVATIKTPKIKACWAQLSDLSPRLIWLSDTACAKIHLNAKFYEKDFNMKVEPTAEGYLQAYDAWLRLNFDLHIAAAMREAAETYCVVLPGSIGAAFARPIPYL